MDQEAPCEKMNKLELTAAVREALKAAKREGIIPAEWKTTVSCRWAGYTKSITVKVSGYQPFQDLVARRGWERKIESVINEFNYNRSQIEYDHHDVGYFTNVSWK